MKPLAWLPAVPLALAVLGALPCPDRSYARERAPDGRPVLEVPRADSPPAVDGKLDDPCWRAAAETGPLVTASGKAGKPATEALLLVDDAHLYVGVRCARRDAAGGEVESDEPAREAECVELLIDSNGDRNSYYRVRIAAENEAGATTSYHEHDPPWHDRTWQPPFPWATASAPGAWSAEFALPLTMFSKNRTLAAEIDFNVRRSGMSGGETQCWCGTFSDPTDAGVLSGIPPRDRLPRPDYVPLDRLYRPPPKARRDRLAEKREMIPLGPGSAHPGTTGEVTLELEGFLLAGDPHARGILWDMAVAPKTGELYVLSDPRPVREAPNLRVFDRHGRYLRTIIPMNPNLPRSTAEDLCRAVAREGEAELVIPKLFETLCGSLSLYGPWWHLPQKVAVAPDGHLILSNIYRGTLWRMRPDGGLPEGGWTSIYHRGRNEPFESTAWTQNYWQVSEVTNYLPFHSLHYPYFGFDPDGAFFISAGQTSRPTRQYGYHWEVGQQGESYHWDVPEGEARGTCVWKCRLRPGPRVEKLACYGGFAEPCGVAVDGDHLVVADAGNNRLQVLGEDGRLAASITHYKHEGKWRPLYGPTALAVDGEGCLYVLAVSQKRGADPRVERTLASLRQAVNAEARQPRVAPGRLIKLKSWREPELLAVSEPLHGDVMQIALDAGVAPPLVWVANGAGPGSLLQLAGDDLSVRGRWADDGAALSCPRQSGNQPLLNIDPQTGHLYVEDDSNYRIKQYGTVYRIDQDGNVLRKWPPRFFDARALRMTSPWGGPDHERHFRYPDEPRFLDSFFGKDGRVYRWKLGTAGVEILRFDREGRPVPYAATGTNALFVDPPMQVNFWHDTYHGMDVDRQGNLFYVAKVDADPPSRPVSAYQGLHRQVNVYDADGHLRKRALLVLECVRGLQVDDQGNLYTLHRPANRPWDDYLALSKYPPSGGEPIWSRPWEGYIGQAEVLFAPCHCITSRQHQTLDGRGYLFAAGKYSVQVIDCETGAPVGEFGSYGNMDCQGKGSRFPHPELPFGTISALSVWKDRLFVVDVLNRRIAKCRIHYDEAAKERP